jgi:hypothetical protein
MNTKKTIYDKLFKEETQLAKHEVELALADDIKASLSAYKGLKDNVEKTKNAAKNSFIKYSDSVRVAYQNSKNSVDLITKLEVEAKKLGIGDTGYGGWKKESTAKMSEYKSLLTAIDKIYQSI